MKAKQTKGETTTDAVYAAIADLEDGTDAQLIAYASKRCGQKSPWRNSSERFRFV